MLERLIAPLLYFPSAAHEGWPAQFGLAYETVTLTPAGGPALHGWWFPAPRPVASLLFCHGNAGNISHRLDNVARLVGVGFSVLIFDYRGYGLSQGRPTERGLTEDARAAWQHFLALAQPPRYIFGRLLGGAVALALAEQIAGDDLAGLILESTFTSLGDMAGQVFPLPGLKRLIRGYPSLARLKRMQRPLLIIHGQRDELIPFAHGQRLFQAANQPKSFYPIAGAGHNDTYLIGGRDYLERLVAFAVN